MRSLRPAGVDGRVSAERIRQARNCNDRAVGNAVGGHSLEGYADGLSRVAFELAELGSAGDGLEKSAAFSCLAIAMKKPIL
jgi:hypothetical protein